MSVLIGVVAVVAAVITYRFYASVRRYRRMELIRTYSFPRGLLARLSEKYPNLTLKEAQLVSRGLRQFFICNLMAKGNFVSMPSKVVDELWHEFILFTKQYDEFCRHAFGQFLHHTPAVVLSSQTVANAGLRRAWWFACKEESINPRLPTRVPLLFALDSKLAIPGGFRYVPDCSQFKDNKGDRGSSAANCATDFHSRSYDGGTDGFGDSASSTSGDAGSADSGGSGCGGGSGGD